MKKVCVITGSRAEYGAVSSFLKEVALSDKIKIQLIVTGMHLSKKHGYSIRDIYKDKIPIYKKINTNIKKDTTKEHVKSLGLQISKLAEAFAEIKPDLRPAKFDLLDRLWKTTAFESG